MLLFLEKMTTDSPTTPSIPMVRPKKPIAKRFNVTSITRDKEYTVTKGSPGSKMLYFTCQS